MADRRRAMMLWLICCIFFLCPLTAQAAETAEMPEAVQGVVYRNAETGYTVLIEDDADLLTESERAALAEQMQEITAYGSAAFKTISENGTSAGSFAQRYYASVFSNKSGILFLIDMDNRKIWIYCDGAIYKTVTKDYADTITDNVYTYASAGNYYQCASSAFEQAETLLKGHQIAQPMKYICNALLAMIAALLINFGLVNLFSRTGKTSDSELLSHALGYFSHSAPTVCFEFETKTYSPASSDSGSSGGGGGGGGGGSSGGGGGHSF